MTCKLFATVVAVAQYKINFQVFATASSKKSQ